MQDEQWGPWIEHDGKGCPVPDGTFVEVYGWEVHRGSGLRRLSCNVGIAKAVQPMWEEVFPEGPSVIRYRVRKPRALAKLRALVEDLPAQSEKVDA